MQRRGDEITQDDLGRPVVRQQDLGRRGDVAGLLQPGAPGQADPGRLRHLFPAQPRHFAAAARRLAPGTTVRLTLPGERTSVP